MNNTTAVLETALRKGSGHFTLSEASAVTGFVLSHRFLFRLPDDAPKGEYSHNFPSNLYK